MDVTATLIKKSVPSKILNSTVWLLQLRGLPHPKSRRKILWKKWAGRKEEYLTIICLWQVMFYLKLQCTQTAKPGRLCNLKAELVQHMHKHPRLLLAASIRPQSSLHLSPPPSLPHQIL